MCGVQLPKFLTSERRAKVGIALFDQGNGLWAVTLWLILLLGRLPRCFEIVALNKTQLNDYIST
jgi:hypothetical protein